MYTCKESLSEVLFEMINQTLCQFGISWKTALQCRLTIHLSICEGITSSWQNFEYNPAIYINGCPCHSLHNTTSKASEKFTEVVGFDVEDFLVDIYYWLDKSTKLQVQLESFCNFCDQDFKKVIKHVSTQWLGLESCVTRTLRLFQALRFYFLSEENPSPHFQRLVSKLTNQMREVYLFFFIKMYFNHLRVSTYFYNEKIHWFQGCILPIQRFFQRLGCKFHKLDVMADKTPS